MARSNPRPDERLHALADLFASRNAEYGDTFNHFGALGMALFPDGLTLETEEEWGRFGVLMMVMSKVQRIAANFKKGGHPDSNDDLAVYSQMLAFVDEGARG